MRFLVDIAAFVAGLVVGAFFVAWRACTRDSRRIHLG